MVAEQRKSDLEFVCRGGSSIVLAPPHHIVKGTRTAQALHPPSMRSPVPTGCTACGRIKPCLLWMGY
jgi:hypothetical protein